MIDLLATASIIFFFAVGALLIYRAATYESRRSKKIESLTLALSKKSPEELDRLLLDAKAKLANSRTHDPDDYDMVSAIIRAKDMKR